MANYSKVFKKKLCQRLKHLTSTERACDTVISVSIRQVALLT